MTNDHKKTNADIAEEAARKACEIIALAMDLREGDVPMKSASLRRFMPTLTKLIRNDYEEKTDNV